MMMCHIKSKKRLYTGEWSIQQQQRTTENEKNGIDILTVYKHNIIIQVNVHGSTMQIVLVLSTWGL